ncbi:porin [Pseudomonas putida JB]|uniref:OprD family porin n=1 Tax=Pseudomonas TaxID=286 RepID=UPI0008791E84|nr:MULTISPECIES: OprD family porin [Pseudomonas]AOX08777.1 porin [Pseudomonas putida JB]MDN4512028.1 OprD family porin [Pseudomonas sp. 2,4-D]
MKPQKAIHVCTLLGLGNIATPAMADGFIEGSKVSLQTKNFYLNRDFRDGSGQNKRDEWAQGFILDAKSGFTPGPVGFGIDAIGMLGLKLDSSPDRTATGLLPVHDDGKAPDEYSKLGLTAKARFSDSMLEVGTLIPDMPTVKANNGRIFPQTFRGGLLKVGEIDSLNVVAGRLTKVTDRDQTASQDLVLNTKNRRFQSGVSADNFDLAGFDYTFSKNMVGSYQYGKLEDVYAQHFFGLAGSVPFAAGQLKADLRLAMSKDSGSAAAGKVDNRSANGMVTYSIKGHALGVGYQQMSGDTAFPYIDGTDPYLINFVQINDFAGAKEKSWQLRYDFNFAAAGIPGLTFMSRYVKGHDVELANAGTGEEWERNTELQYVLQSGALKNLGVRWRNASYRSDFARGADENRLIISYSIPLR